MTYLIPLRCIMLLVSSVLGIKCDSCNSYTTTYEENKGRIESAKDPNNSTWTKKIIKWNHLREHIKQSTSKIVILKQMNNKPTSWENH